MKTYIADYMADGHNEFMVIHAMNFLQAYRIFRRRAPKGCKRYGIWESKWK